MAPKDIFYQLINTFERILKIPIGKIGDGHCEFQNVTVAMIQTVAHVFDKKVKVLAKDNKILAEKAEVIKQFLDGIECVLIDEAHHVAADTFWAVMQNIPHARYRIGVTATPFREDNMDIMLEGALAKQFIKVSSSDLIGPGSGAHPSRSALSSQISQHLRDCRASGQAMTPAQISLGEFP